MSTDGRTGRAVPARRPTSAPSPPPNPTPIEGDTVSYNAIAAAAAADPHLKARVAACFAQETTGPEQPEALASVHMWRIVATSPIADAYSYAVAANVPNPGKDEAVVTDANILAAVTAIVAPAAVEE